MNSVTQSIHPRAYPSTPTIQRIAATLSVACAAISAGATFTMRRDIRREKEFYAQFKNKVD